MELLKAQAPPEHGAQSLNTQKTSSAFMTSTKSPLGVEPERQRWQERAEWLAREVLPSEDDVRSWLTRHIRGLTRTDVDDAIQECYARLWDVDYKRIGNARAYFFTMARNVIGEMMRRSRVLPMDVMTQIEWLRVEGEDSDAERHSSDAQDAQRLQLAISKLPPKCRRVFMLRTYEALSQREIAERTGLAESTVEKHLAKGLRLVMQDIQSSSTASAARKVPAYETRRTKGS